MSRLFAIKTTRGGPKDRESYLANEPGWHLATGRASAILATRTVIVGLDEARRFNTAGDASAWMDTFGLNPNLCEIVPVPPASAIAAEDRARAEWVDRGGRVQMGEAR